MTKSTTYQTERLREILAKSGNRVIDVGNGKKKTVSKLTGTDYWDILERKKDSHPLLLKLYNEKIISRSGKRDRLISFQRFGKILQFSQKTDDETMVTYLLLLGLIKDSDLNDKKLIGYSNLEIDVPSIQKYTPEYIDSEKTRKDHITLSNNNPENTLLYSFEEFEEDARETLKTTGNPYSPEAEKLMEKKLRKYARDLVSEAVKLARRDGLQQVGTAHVFEAIKRLITIYNQHNLKKICNSIGGALMGTGLSLFGSSITSSTIQVSHVSIHIVILLSGVILLMIGLRD